MLKLYIFSVTYLSFIFYDKYTHTHTHRQNQYWIRDKYGPFIKFYSILIEIMIMT